MSDDARNAYAAHRRASIASTLDEVASKRSPFSGGDLLGNGEGLVVTVLAGGRPRLLSKTMDGVAAALGGLPKARMVVYLNQEDALSEAEVPDYAEVLKNSSGGISSIGKGYAALAESVGKARWWLHVEDDWHVFDIATMRQMLRESVWALEWHQDVVQVRLRFWKERVLSRHMVTNRPITWTLREDYYPVTKAHWTFNPSLMRGSSAAWFVGIEGEQAAQRRVHAQNAHAKIIQAIPGVFVHLGEDSSLRRSSGRGPDTHGT